MNSLQADKPVIHNSITEDMELLLDFAEEAREHMESAESGLLELETSPDSTDLLNSIFRAFHTLKGMAGFLNLNEIGTLAHAAENLLDGLRQGQLPLTSQRSDLILESIDHLKRMVPAALSAAEGKPLDAGKQTLEVLLSKLKTTMSQHEEEPRVEESKSAETVIDSPSTATESSSTKASTPTSDTIKISTDRLDRLINVAGELVIAQSMVAEEVGHKFAHEHTLNHKVNQQDKMIRELQELSMAMRMVPIQGVFQRMTRLVRDLSRQCGKKVNLVTKGAETELDRTIVDRIADPLIHMVRNSLDHGLEPPEQRLERGKDETGRLELRASHQSGQIVIEVEDDGRGLDRDKILAKAVGQQLVSPDVTLTDEEIFKLIFHPGFSTAEKVTSVSGRGVGMDVVKRNIEELHGKIDIQSTLGQGTLFAIRLPLTLAVMDGQIVRVGPEDYIIPISSIIHSFQPQAEQVSSVLKQGEISLDQGEILPVVRLHQLFQIPWTPKDLTQCLLVVVEDNGRRCGLLVEDLLGQQQVVIKALGGLGVVQGISGGAIMGNGRIRLILDIPALMDLSRKQERRCDEYNNMG